MASSRGSQAAISITLMAAGLSIMIGGISGNLAPMLAALFDPSVLVKRSNQGSGMPIAPPVAPVTKPPSTGAPELSPPPETPSSPFDIIPEWHLSIPDMPALGTGAGDVPALP